MTSDPYGPETIAAVSGAATLAWYAMPDLIRSRPLRGLLKTTILAGGTGYLARLMAQRGLDPGEVLEGQVWGTREVVSGVVGAIAATAAMVASERAIFAFGERRRAQGHRLGHTLPAVGLAALASAVAVLGKLEPARH